MCFDATAVLVYDAKPDYINNLFAAEAHKQEGSDGGDYFEEQIFQGGD